MTSNTPQWTHGGRVVRLAWVVEFEGATEVDALEQAADWIAEIGSDTLAVTCSTIRYDEGGPTVVVICFEPNRSAPGPTPNLMPDKENLAQWWRNVGVSPYASTADSETGPTTVDADSHTAPPAHRDRVPQTLPTR